MSTFSEAIKELGIREEDLPKGVMGFAESKDYRSLSGMAAVFAKNPDNRQVLCYEIETEHERSVGLVLRNLWAEKGRAKHIDIIFVDDNGAEYSAPFFHNLTPALEMSWGTNVLVAVEGAKDARILHQEGVPAVAYMGAAPSEDWLYVIARYAATLIWIPDNDGYLDKQVFWRRKKVEDDAKEVGLKLRKVVLRGSKDPAMLAYNPREMARIKSLYIEEVEISR